MIDPPPDAHRLTPDTLPTPFSAQQIREACAPGRSNTFRVERQGDDPYVARWEFVDGDEDGADSLRWTESLEGLRLEAPSPSASRWSELQAHASYPASTTTIAVETIDIPAGRFECWVYTTELEGSEVARAWFAKDLPGPPVLVRSEVGGTIVFSSTLIRFEVPPQ